MGKSDFGMPEIDATCDVCGVRFNQAHGSSVSDKFVCVFCSRFRHMVHALRYVEHMAARDCVIVSLDEYCSLNCGCYTCSARKVLKFIKGWQNAYGSRPVRRPR